MAWTLIEQVLKLGANPNDIDINGQTPLFYIARDGRCGILDKFMEKNINLNHQDKFL